VNHHLSAVLVGQHIADCARRRARVTPNGRFGPRHPRGVGGIAPFTTPTVREAPYAPGQARVEAGQW
jgi:hypothetical protein